MKKGSDRNAKRAKKRKKDTSESTTNCEISVTNLIGLFFSVAFIRIYHWISYAWIFFPGCCLFIHTENREKNIVEIEFKHLMNIIWIKFLCISHEWQKHCRYTHTHAHACTISNIQYTSIRNLRQMENNELGVKTVYCMQKDFIECEIRSNSNNHTAEFQFKRTDSSLIRKYLVSTRSHIFSISSSSFFRMPSSHLLIAIDRLLCICQ